MVFITGNVVGRCGRGSALPVTPGIAVGNLTEIVYESKDQALRGRLPAYRDVVYTIIHNRTVAPR